MLCKYATLISYLPDFVILNSYIGLEPSIWYNKNLAFSVLAPPKVKYYLQFLTHISSYRVMLIYYTNGLCDCLCICQLTTLKRLDR